MVGNTVRVDVGDTLKSLRAVGIAVNAKHILEAIGFKVVRWIDQNFKQQGTEARWKPLSPNTIAGRRKGGGSGSAQILQDTGRLKQSFTVPRVTGRKAIIGGGTNVRYASFHEEGTKPYIILPKAKKALSFMTVGGKVVFKKVRHPGLAQRRMTPTDKTLEGLAESTLEGLLKRAIEMRA